MPPPRSSSVCILAPVYQPYRWLAPFMAECLDRFWADHPPVFFCGLEKSEANGLPILPLRAALPPRDWVLFLRDAVDEAASAGFSKCYLLLEEHLALAECASRHLNETLPDLMDDLEAAYIGLMGWDNRRYTTRAPILDASWFHLMHLNTEQAPRFHLHPSLWTLEALRGCLDLVSRDATHTPWRFEKVLEKRDANLPENWKDGCYQVCGREMAQSAPGALARAVDYLVNGCYHRAMALFPHLPTRALRARAWDAFGFDAFFFHGPYPMFFSGVMAKGRLNAAFVRHMQRRPGQQPLLSRLLEAERANREIGRESP